MSGVGGDEPAMKAPIIRPVGSVRQGSGHRPLYRLQTKPHRGVFFYVRDFLDTAWGKGTAMVIALVTGLLAAILLAYCVVRRYTLSVVALLALLWFVAIVGLGVWALVEGRAMLR